MHLMFLIRHPNSYQIWLMPILWAVGLDWPNLASFHLFSFLLHMLFCYSFWMLLVALLISITVISRTRFGRKLASGTMAVSDYGYCDSTEKKFEWIPWSHVIKIEKVGPIICFYRYGNKGNFGNVGKEQATSFFEKSKWLWENSKLGIIGEETPEGVWPPAPRRNV